MADQSITYRWMRPEDGAALSRLHRRAVLLDAVRLYSPEIAHSWIDELGPGSYIESAAKGSKIEVAQIHGAVVGFCSVREGEIRGLYVDPGFMRRGIASGLMGRAMGRLAEAGFERVTVTAALSGVPFYEAAGFVTVRKVLHPTRGGLEMAVAEMERALERKAA